MTHETKLYGSCSILSACSVCESRGSSSSQKLWIGTDVRIRKSCLAAPAGGEIAKLVVTYTGAHLRGASK